jgi:4-amino-4-deoxy-L-arabinose transferase-like glycosyltransferase
VTLAELIRGARGYWLLAALCLGLYLPGLAALPATDRDEARFAQATRQMLESHDLLHIRFQDEARNKKPAGIYWLQAVSVGLLSNAESTEIWPYRLPSVLGALAAVLLTFGFAARALPRATAFLAAALLAASLGLTVEAHLAKTDAVLLATVAAAQFSLGEIYLANGQRGPSSARWPFLFWIAQGVAILVKGPVTPLLSLLTVAALSIADRDWRWLARFRAHWGLPLAVLIAGPWLVAITLATNGAFVSESLGTDFLSKLIHTQEGHGAPPGTYLALTMLGFWPGSIALGAAALLGWRQRAEPTTRFLLAWIVPFWLVLEVVPTKLPNYILPVYPALALLAARALLDPAAASYWGRWLSRLVAVLWVLLALAMPAALLVAPLALLDHLPILASAAALASLTLAAMFLAAIWNKQQRPLLPVAAALLLWISAFAWVLPTLDPLWLSRGVARLESIAGRSQRPLAASGDSEPSLVFLLGTNTKFMSGADAARFLAQTQGGLALIESREETAFQAALPQAAIAVRTLGSVAGIDYSNGRHFVLTLYERAEP